MHPSYYHQAHACILVSLARLLLGCHKINIDVVIVMDWFLESFDDIIIIGFNFQIET